MLAKALEMEKAAEKKSKAFFGGTSKHEEAGEMYMKAGNFYKIDKLWPQAAAAYEKAAASFRKAESAHDVVNAMGEAANSFRKFSIADAVRLLTDMLVLEVDAGHLQAAARGEKTIAEMLEGDGNMEGALQHYQRAADFFRGEESNSAASACLLKVAQIAAQHKEDYGMACNIYEEQARKALENHLTKWSARDHYLKGGLCRLAMGDPVGARQTIQRYMDEDITFSETRECKLLNAIVDAWDKMDVEAFTACVFEFDQISKLDQFKTQILLKVKNMIKAGENPT